MRIIKKEFVTYFVFEDEAYAEEYAEYLVQFRCIWCCYNGYFNAFVMNNN